MGINRAGGRGNCPDRHQIVIELAIEALERRRMFSARAEIRVARGSLFTEQAISRDLVASGRKKEISEIREFISTIVPDL